MNVATLGQRKGQLELLQAIGREPKFLHARCKFIFLGYEQHPYGDTLRKFVSENGLGDLVCILGPKQNALEYIRAGDFTLLSSKSESFGRTLLESQALSTPVISTRVGIAEELIDHGVNGYLLDELPSKEAAQVLLKACSMSEPEYSAMSISSLDKYEAGFSKTHYIKAFNEIMNDFKASVEKEN